ncbi:MAG: uracil-DNA glycosylase [Pseudomonadales bacterium]
MSDARTIKLEQSWLELLEDQFSQPYMEQLRSFLLKEKQQGKVIYPRSDEIFNALNTTPFSRVKVVILGQDPYHGPGQAHGLCFSVQKDVTPPPSLVNIFKEIASDLGLETHPFEHGCLTGWAKQGVLLLNAVLTVERHKAGSHQGKGWETFTDRVIEVISEKRESCVFLLWGSYAQKKGSVIDRNRHLVLTAPHPSPLSAHRGFIGCRHFSQCNDYLKANGNTPIDWASLEP